MTASITARQGFVGRLFESMKNNDKGRCLVLFLNKKKLFQLDRRLQTCASMVRENHVLADIGTDHAYLPIWLVKKEVIKKAIASDINMGPLQKAAFNIRRYNVGKQVDARLSDGLELIFPNEADDIVIAGMGGELIADIIEKAPWLKDAQKHLILQPMTSAPELRTYLSEHGFAVKQEQAVQDGDHIYTVMQAEYDPEHVQTSQVFPYIGILKADSDENKAYIQQQCSRLQKRINGLRQSGKQESLANQTEQILEQLQRVLSQAELGGAHGYGRRYLQLY